MWGRAENGYVFKSSPVDSEMQPNLWFKDELYISHTIINMVKDHMCMHAKSLQSCPTLCDPMDYSPPGSSVHDILQARILEWVANSSSKGSSRRRDWTHVSCVSCIAGTCFSTWEDQVEMKLNRMVTPKRTPWRLKATLLCLGNERSFGIFQERLATCLPLEFLP